MRRDFWLAGGLVGIGLACLAILGWLVLQRTQRPAATGDLGVVKLYVQTAKGPLPLKPGYRPVLPRPQDIVFEVEVDGSGPRWVRVETESATGRVVHHEIALQAPYPRDYLEYVLHLSETAPDQLKVLVTVEAPHVMPVTSEFPLQLQGGDTTFWENEDDVP